MRKADITDARCAYRAYYSLNTVRSTLSACFSLLMILAEILRDIIPAHKTTKIHCIISQYAVRTTQYEFQPRINADYHGFFSPRRYEGHEGKRNLSADAVLSVAEGSTQTCLPKADLHRYLKPKPYNLNIALYRLLIN